MEFFSNLANYVQNMPPSLWFWLLFAAIAVGSALEVVMQKSPLNSAIALIFTFAALSANYVLLKAQFLAAIQLIVYAGAIIVLFVFVIMLLNVRFEESRLDRYGALKWIVTPSVVVLFAAVFYVAKTAHLDRIVESPRSADVGTVEAIGRGLFTTYLLPFEAASVLIMMALVGALVLAQRTRALELETEATAEPPAASAEPEDVEVQA
jgi:NADH-quinone oxidoreductase subunit J